MSLARSYPKKRIATLVAPLLIITVIASCTSSQGYRYSLEGNGQDESAIADTLATQGIVPGMRVDRSMEDQLVFSVTDRLQYEFFNRISEINANNYQSELLKCEQALYRFAAPNALDIARTPVGTVGYGLLALNSTYQERFEILINLTMQALEQARKYMKQDGTLSPTDHKEISAAEAAITESNYLLTVARGQDPTGSKAQYETALRNAVANGFGDKPENATTIWARKNRLFDFENRRDWYIQRTRDVLEALGKQRFTSTVQLLNEAIRLYGQLDPAGR